MKELDEKIRTNLDLIRTAQRLQETKHRGYGLLIRETRQLIDKMQKQLMQTAPPTMKQ